MIPMIMRSDPLSISIGHAHETAVTPKTERADAAANRALILQTAEQLFSEHGVAAVNMAEIAQAAGVGKGTLYRRFSNKAELCLALMDSQLRDFQEAMLGRMRQMNNQDTPYLEQLDQFLDALVYFVEDHAPLLHEVQREGLLDGSVHSYQRPHFWFYMTISGLLQSARQQGELAADVDIPYTADALLSAVHISIFRYQREGRGFSLARMSAGLRRLVAGLKTET